MQRKKVIVVLENDKEPEVFGNFKKACKEPEVFGNFKKACKELGLPYHSLKMLKFPIRHSEYEFHKVKFN